MGANELWLLRMVEERFHRDDEGRPIREGRTPPEFLRDGDIEWRSCPYSGSRQRGLPMNVSALHQMSAHWDAMLGALGFMRAAYTRARGSYTADLLDIWRVSQLASALPWYFILGNRPCPAYAAALSKATLGVNLWGAKLLAMTRDGFKPPSPFSSASMLELAEQIEALVAETEVCSGSDRMLLRFFDVVTNDTFPSESVLEQERDDVMLFAAHYLSYKQLLWLYFMMRRFLLADCEAAIGKRADLADLLAAPCEPPDFSTIEPPAPALVPLGVRAAWFGTLADMMISIAPDGSDRATRELALRMAALMGDERPAQLDTIAAEVAGAAPANAVGVVARTIATFVELDRLFGDGLGIVEAGFRRATHAPALSQEIDAGDRDRAQAAPMRRVLASFAPVALAGAR